MDEPEEKEKRPWNVKFNDAKKKRYLECLAKGMRRGKAATACNVTRQIVNMHADADPEFKRQCALAEDAYCDHVEEMLLSCIDKGNVMAQLAWLQNRSWQGRWQDKRATNTVTISPPPDPMMEEILKRLIAKEEKENKDNDSK